MKERLNCVLPEHKKSSGAQVVTEEEKKQLLVYYKERIRTEPKESEDELSEKLGVMGLSDKPKVEDKRKEQKKGLKNIQHRILTK